jgi:hypothetical protein
MSLMLDLVRGCSVFLGAGAYLGERATHGRWNPMSTSSRGVRGEKDTENVCIPPETPFNRGEYTNEAAGIRAARAIRSAHSLSEAHQ